MFEIMDRDSQEAVIKVIGVGGCGGNAVAHMIEKNVGGVEFICANTDMQALKKSTAKTILQKVWAQAHDLKLVVKPH